MGHFLAPLALEERGYYHHHQETLEACGVYAPMCRPSLTFLQQYTNAQIIKFVKFRN